jgi:hypothetical protein
MNTASLSSEVAAGVHLLMGIWIVCALRRSRVYLFQQCVAAAPLDAAVVASLFYGDAAASLLGMR